MCPVLSLIRHQGCQGSTCRSNWAQISDFAQRRRRILVLDAVAHRYDQTLSDISGMDVESHGNNVGRLIKAVRDWLNAGREVRNPLPGSAAISEDYTAFQVLVPDIIAELRLDSLDALSHVDYMHLVETALPLIESARGS